MTLKNDRLIRALLKQPVDSTPVWMMRQAGRYLPEYKKTRAQAGDFLSLCKNTDFATEVTMQPLRRYALDAAILFSDILTIPDAMGLGLYFEEGEGPKFRKTVRSEKDVNDLHKVVIDKDLGYVTDAVASISRALGGDVPLIGFSGSPWTLATYMVEGQSTRDFHQVKNLAYNQPEVMHQLLTILADTVIDYLNAQIKAGAQVVQIFDTWGGVLSHSAYQEFSLQYMTKIVGGLIREYNGMKVPVILFTKNGGLWLEAIAESGCDALGLDWTIDIGQARSRVGGRVALQGNMDPAILYAKPERIREEVKSILASFGKGSGHVFNLGHGITPGVDPENAGVFIDAVHEFSSDYHS